MVDVHLLTDLFGTRSVVSDFPAGGDQLHINQSLAGIGLTETELISGGLTTNLELRAKFRSVCLGNTLGLLDLFDTLKEFLELRFLESEFL